MGFWVGSRSVQGLTLARNPGSGDTGYTVDQGRVGSGPGRIPKPGTTLYLPEAIFPYSTNDILHPLLFAALLF